MSDTGMTAFADPGGHTGQSGLPNIFIVDYSAINTGRHSRPAGWSVLHIDFNNLASGFGGETQHLTARNLMDPNEIMKLAPDTLLRGENPLIVKKLSYYTDKEFAGLFDAG